MISFILLKLSSLLSLSKELSCPWHDTCAPVKGWGGSSPCTRTGGVCHDCMSSSGVVLKQQ